MTEVEAHRGKYQSLGVSARDPFSGNMRCSAVACRDVLAMQQASEYGST